MRSVKFVIAAGAASMLSTTAFAADMPSIMPPPPAYAPAPQPCCDTGGWYLRGDIGMTNHQTDNLTLTSAPFPAGFNTTGLGFDSSTLYDVGVGYQFNNWFRADVTGQYRGRSNLHGSQFSTIGSFAPGFAANDNYSGSYSSTVVMLNGYVDLGTWWCVTPFVGAGIGAAYNQMSAFRDDGVIYNSGVLSNSATFAGDAGKWDLAWAVHAGLAYHVTNNLTVELAYSYMNLGSAVTGLTNSFDGVTVVNGSGFTLKDITSNDIKLGVRWNFDQPYAPAPAPMLPLVRKG
jgi:opacity protein-like surface antigen